MNTTYNTTIHFFENVTVTSPYQKEPIELNCTELDHIYNEVMTHAAAETLVFFAFVASTFAITSIALLFVGEKIIRPTISIVSALSGLVLGFVFSGYVSIFTCEARLIVGAVFAFVCCMVAVFIMKIGFFVLGAVTFGAFGHYLYEIIPANHIPTVFAFQGRNGVYWIAILLFGLGGAIIGLVCKKEFLRIGSSMLGGVGVSFSIYLFMFKVGQSDGEPPHVMLLLIAILCTIAGIAIQTVLDKKLKNKNKVKKKENESK